MPRVITPWQRPTARRELNEKMRSRSISHGAIVSNIRFSSLGIAAGSLLICSMIKFCNTGQSPNPFADENLCNNFRPGNTVFQPSDDNAVITSVVASSTIRSLWTAEARDAMLQLTAATRLSSAARSGSITLAFGAPLLSAIDRSFECRPTPQSSD
jgi:hypothetical protein